MKKIKERNSFLNILKDFLNPTEAEEGTLSEEEKNALKEADKNIEKIKLNLTTENQKDKETNKSKLNTPEKNLTQQRNNVGHEER